MTAGAVSQHGRFLWRRVWEGQRFVVLFTTLLLVLFTTPLMHALAPGAPRFLTRTFIGAFFVVLVLSAVAAVSRSRRITIAVGLLAAPVLLTQLGAIFTDLSKLDVIRDVLTIAFLGFVSLIVLRHLFTVSRVTIDTICASLCIYLLMAIIWALNYSLLETWRPNSFDLSASMGGGSMGLDDDNSLYYSLVTITTLGYGDITPITPASRIMSATEAVVGQIFLVVLVARLIGMQIAQSTAERRERQAGDD